MTMVKSSKKALAVLLAVACLITFMPAMASQSFAAKKLTVKPAKKTIYVKKSFTLKANQKVKWSASKSSLKVVKLTSKKAKSVKVTGKKAGKAVVTAKVGKQTKKVTITVKKAKAAVKKTAVTAVALSADNTKDPAKEVKVGTKLRAEVTPENATVTYQWKADGTAIAGATKSTFTVTTAEIGKAITVEATGTGNFEKTAVSAATAKVATPVLTDVVVNKYNATSAKFEDQVTANENVGTQLKVNLTGENIDDSVVTYQWYKKTEVKNTNGTTTKATTAINGATGNEYTLTKDDINSSVFVVVTPQSGVTLRLSGNATTGIATTGDYKGSWVSADVKVGNNISVALTVNGTDASKVRVVAGTTLTAVVTPSDADVTYQWYRGTAKIAGATSSTYTTVAADENSVIKVEVKISANEKTYSAVSKNGDSVTDSVEVKKAATLLTKAVLKYTSSLTEDTYTEAEKKEVLASDYPLGKFVPTAYTTDENGLYTLVTSDVKTVWYVNGTQVAFKTSSSEYTVDLDKDGNANNNAAYKKLSVGDEVSFKAVGQGNYEGTEVTSNSVKITKLGLMSSAVTGTGSLTYSDANSTKTLTLADLTGLDKVNFTATLQVLKTNTDGSTTWVTLGTATKLDSKTATDDQDKITFDINTTENAKLTKDNQYRVVITSADYVGNVSVTK
ncbi:hypothetical protein [Eubacterium pyruvativorans]|uniref:hypothetical protein n=1 Tax=Eubacterium pyruvativorans TaxID=155865 RepID=UPI003F8BD037